MARDPRIAALPKLALTDDGAAGFATRLVRQREAVEDAFARRAEEAQIERQRAMEEARQYRILFEAIGAPPPGSTTRVSDPPQFLDRYAVAPGQWPLQGLPPLLVRMGHPTHPVQTPAKPVVRPEPGPRRIVFDED